MKKTTLQKLVIVLCVSVVASSVAGCTSLRKKFTRKKKKDFTEEFEPVLNPVDYPPMRESVTDQYAYHASLRQVWHKGLMETIETKGSDKRIKYYFDQILVEMDEMISLLNNDGKLRAEDLRDQLKEIRGEFDRPFPMRQMPTIERKLRLIDGDIKDELKLDIVHDHLIPVL